MRIRSRVISYSVPLPPAAGTPRAEFLRWQGGKELMQSLHEYGKSLLLLGIDLMGDIGKIPLPRGIEGLPVTVHLNGKTHQDSWRLAGISVNNCGRMHLSFRFLGISALEPNENSYFGSLRDLPVWKAAESAARNSLNLAVDAYNCLEDSDIADPAHQHVHNIAAFVSGYFGCKIRFDEDVYLDTCALSLVHHRWGNSVGFTSRRVCSICREDLDECAHLLDVEYPVLVQKLEGICNVCGTEGCSHVNGETVESYPSPVIDAMDLREVSVVPRPRDPHARPVGIEIDLEFLERLLGHDPSGRDVKCTRCLYQCDGFYDPWLNDSGDAVLATPYSQGLVRRRGRRQ
ncbi:hypothetical protein ACFFQW_25955 [Umezawaea endophytica]|uniref:Uncharacterized protein n=1 Tax=Umezawaea endophytica TaxID=1654476 RepID=A0A9X2VM60_9PSEU|nr:hypothetical protein [Umezawaea endophytica]MCS7479075.1 hypothetical protein [Umezawaea endophytica]